MKKLLFLLMITALFGVACSETITKPQPDSIVTPPSEPAPTSLTSNEARTIAQKWLDEHPDVQLSSDNPNTLEYVCQNMTFNGEEYYMFQLDDAKIYWFSILVHTETGSLLHRFTPDGEFPVEEIEPLDDWYNRYYLEN